MIKLTKAEILDALSTLYAAKQDMAALDDALNAQASTITAKAKADIQAIRDSQLVLRQAAQASIDTVQTQLDKGK